MLKLHLFFIYREEKTRSKKELEIWSLGFRELLRDSYGKRLFAHFLELEFSKENLHFWDACEDLKQCPQSKVEAKVTKIKRWADYHFAYLACGELFIFCSKNEFCTRKYMRNAFHRGSLSASLYYSLQRKLAQTPYIHMHSEIFDWVIVVFSSFLQRNGYDPKICSLRIWT